MSGVDRARGADRHERMAVVRREREVPERNQALGIDEPGSTGTIIELSRSARAGPRSPLDGLVVGAAVPLGHEERGRTPNVRRTMDQPERPAATPSWTVRGDRRPAVAAFAAFVVTLALTACGGAAPAPPPPDASPSAVASPGPTVSARDACVAATLAPLTLRQQVGQVLLVGTPLADPTSVVDLVARYEVGGVFLAGRSRASGAALTADIAALRANVPPATGLLIALDQEGGDVQTLQGDDFPPIPTAVEQGRLSDADLRALTTKWSGRLAAIGVTLDLAPVSDTVPASVGSANPPIGAFERQYGSDPAAVAADIETVVTAVQSAGVLTTLKHFPGLGRVLKNTDVSTGAVDTVATTTDPFLAPFQAGIRAGTAAVMMSSASYPNLDPDAVAAFSAPIVTGLLRQQLGFTGLIVSDDLGAAVAVSSVPVDQRAVRFIQAGGDLALTVAPATAPAMLDGLLAAANASTGFAAKVTAAATSVIRAKYTAGLLPCSPRQ
jgi:beta-N-acetylhexosaminidase